MEKELKTIGVLTSGGDAPGMNAAIRAVTRPVRTVSADDYDAVNAVLSAYLRTLLLSLRGLELHAAGSAQYGASPLDDIGHILGAHIYDLFV